MIGDHSFYEVFLEKEIDARGSLLVSCLKSYRRMFLILFVWSFVLTESLLAQPDVKFFDIYLEEIHCIQSVQEKDEINIRWETTREDLYERKLEQIRDGGNSIYFNKLNIKSGEKRSFVKLLSGEIEKGC